MPAMKQLDPAWNRRIEETKKKAYNQGFRHGLSMSPTACSWKKPEYVAEYTRGYENGRKRYAADAH